ncbi:sensor histidine kinase [Kribbella sp. NBC_00889]|uniref:sensor histidine kinase n=1 Tax=Kribbella sp. NBC_00889 TaxID=2975974 RepID=UPI00386AF097|nr:HAMP domain-containing histidine kinase [Kribbella sp. NBC_00889]
MQLNDRRFTDRYPLRVTIVVVLLTLVALALVASGVLATTIMRGYLVDRVDEQLQQASMPLQRNPLDRPMGPGDGRRRPLPSVFVVQFNDSEGQASGGPFRAQLVEGEAPLPDLPTLNLNQVRALDGHPFNVDAVSGGASWRVLAVPLSDGSGSVMVAQSLHDMSRTLQRLVGVQAAAGVILLVLLAGVGTFVVRRSLRGLEDVENTAVAIAGGDLSRRVPQRDPRTEVGRLSLALNQMLGQIETAFAQRTASEFAARRSEDVARRSEEAARQSEERMRRFVADASHELRTPLTSIRGFAELTRQRGDSGDADTMRRIEDEAKRMGLLVDDLLLLARLDQQRPLRMEPVDLLPIAADALHNAQAVQPERNISLKILPESEAPVVEGDETRLRQVLGNLISNALHHTPTDAPILVSVGTRDGEAVLEVSDSGPGLTDDQKARVFERFYRADSARTRSTGGSGLGLSIVAALVAAHHGRVTVTDTTPHGATFTVHLPLNP